MGVLLRAAVLLLAVTPWVSAQAEPRVTAELALAFPVRFVQSDDHTYYFVRVGDLDNDGNPDYLISRGAVSHEAYNHEGRLLWEHYDRAASFEDVHPESDTRVYDIDGDGRAEAIVARRVDGAIHLCLVDGRTGRIERSVPYPGLSKRRGNWAGIAVANLSGAKRASELVVSWDQSYVAALDARLNLIWEGPADLGQHSPKAADLDGDGRDEVLCSAALLNHNGKLLWSRSELPKVMSAETRRFEPHCADCPLVAEVDGDRDNGPEVFLSTGGWLLRSDGSVVWGLGESVVFGHHADIGTVFPGRNGVGIALVDWRDRGRPGDQRVVSLIDSGGKVVWTEQAEWAVLGDWTGDGLSEVFLGDGRIVTGSGKLAGKVPDFFSNAVVCDVLGDLRDEIVLVRANAAERTAQLEVYTNPAVNPHTATSRVPANRKVTRRVLNWSCY